MSSCYTTISSCGNYQISYLCLPQIYQGDDEYIGLTLLDKAGQPLDLSTVESIEIMVYGVDANYYLEYMCPSVTPYEEITILQSSEGKSLIDEGKIEFFVPSSFTTHLVCGDLYANIRIKAPDTKSPLLGATDTITFPCIKIGDIKFTQLNFRNRFMEDYGV